MAGLPVFSRTYRLDKGSKDLTQRRKGVEKARKENHFNNQEIVTLCAFLGFS